MHKWILNNLSPYFPFVSNSLLHLTYAIAFHVPFIDSTDALNNFFWYSFGRIFLITARTDWGPKIDPPWQLCRGLTSRFLRWPCWFSYGRMEIRGCHILDFCLTFRRVKSFPYMVVNTNSSQCWKLRLGTKTGMSPHRGMPQLVLRMLEKETEF